MVSFLPLGTLKFSLINYSHAHQSTISREDILEGVVEVIYVGVVSTIGYQVLAVALLVPSCGQACPLLHFLHFPVNKEIFNVVRLSWSKLFKH